MSPSLNSINGFFGDTNKAKKQVPKSLVSFFMISQLFFGINFGFSPVLSKKYRCFLEHISNLTTFIFISILVIPCLIYYHELWFWQTFIEYTLYVFSIYTSKYTVYNLIVDINEMYELKSNEKKILLAMTLYTEGMTILKGVLLYMHCEYEEGHCDLFVKPVFYLLYRIPLFALDFVAQTQAIIFLYIYFYVKDLRKNAETNLNPNLLEKQYKGIVRVYDKIKPLYSKLVMEQLIVGVPKMMATLWYMLFYIKLTSHVASYINQLLFSSHIALQIILPALVAEMVNAEMDATKLLLNEELMSSTDERKSAEVSRLLGYMQARPLQHLVFRVVPIDARLLLSLCSICISYFIIILQFTHLYD